MTGNSGWLVAETVVGAVRWLWAVRITLSSPDGVGSSGTEMDVRWDRVGRGRTVWRRRRGQRMKLLCLVTTHWHTGHAQPLMVSTYLILSTGGVAMGQSPRLHVPTPNEATSALRQKSKPKSLSKNECQDTPRFQPRAFNALLSANKRGSLSQSKQDEGDI